MLTCLYLLLGVVVAGLPLAWLVMRRRVRRLEKLLPVRTPEELQNFWNVLYAKKSGVKVLVGILVISWILIPFLGLFDEDVRLPWIWKYYGVMFVGYVILLWLLENCAGLTLDRCFRQTTWNGRSQMTFILGFRLYWTANYWGLVVAAIVSTHLLPHLSGGQERVLPGAGGLVLVYLLASELAWRGGCRIIGVRPLRDEKILGMVSELCREGNIKTLRSFLIPERGGKVPFGGVIGKKLFLSEYLIRNMTEEELRAVIGHEIGHIASGDIRRRTLCAYGAALAGFLLAALIPARSYAHLAWFHPIFSLIIPLYPYYLTTLILLKRYRAAELVADGIGAQLVGSGELMAQALERIHELACLPANFPQEKRMTHPSLVHRLNALRGTVVQPDAAEVAGEETTEPEKAVQ